MSEERDLGDYWRDDQDQDFDSRGERYPDYDCDEDYSDYYEYPEPTPAQKIRARLR